MRPPEERRNFRRDLPGLGVERLAPAENEVAAFLLDRHREGPGSAERVGDSEGPVGQVDAAIGAEPHALSQRLLRLWRAHRHRDDLAALLVAKPSGLGDGEGIESVQLERDALPPELFRLLVELDRIWARDLLDQAGDLQGRDTNADARDPVR